MVRLIGSEGIGIFQMVLPPFTLLLVLTTAGIPLTLSKLISQKIALNQYNEARRIFVIALRVLLVSSLAIATISWIGAPHFIKFLFADSRVYWAYLTLIPALLIVAFSSAYRGYFLGMKQMFPSALSQTIEQVIRIIVGLGAASYLLPYGLEYAAAGLALGIVLGEMGGLIVLRIYYLKNIQPAASDKNDTSCWEVIKNIYSLSIPLTLNRIVGSLLYTAQAIIIPSRLQAMGYSVREATDLYGQFTGIALTLVGLPTIITVSLAMTMVPAISEGMAARNQHLVKKRALTAIRITVLAAFPWVVIFYTIPGPLCQTVFNSLDAGIPLKYLSLGAFFIYLQQTTTGIIQGLGAMLIMLKHTLVGAVINLIGIYILTGSKGIVGTAIAYNVSAAVIAILNLLYLMFLFGINLNLKKIFFGLISAGAMAVVMMSMSNFYDLWGNRLGLTILNLLAGVSVYSLCLFIFGVISMNDIRNLKRI